MDVLEQFLHSISYKFPKGYPDLTNKNDLALLENEFKKIGVDLNELELSKHYVERKSERKNIIDISNLNQQIIGDKNINDVKNQLISQIEKELEKRLSQIENTKTIPLSFKEQIVYKILKPILKSNGETFELQITTQSSKGDNLIKRTGTYYCVFIDDDTLITFMNTSGDDSDLEKQALEHMETLDKKEKPIKILTFADFEYIISLDEETQEVNLIDPTTLPYSIKASYRVGSNFTHKDYGTGKVVAAASSGTRSGEPDSRGIVEWVEVDFGRPYVTGGQLKKTRIIKNVYTSLSSDLDTEATE
jgi:hypothetical protein